MGRSMKLGSQISEQEKFWRTDANDYEARFCGHCNTTTDIKEANFFGRYSVLSHSFVCRLLFVPTLNLVDEQNN